MCDQGYFSNGGATRCTKCRIGTYSDIKGATTCVNVPGGSYSTECDKNLTACKSFLPCQMGYFSSAGTTFCTKCPVGTYSDIEGGTSCIDVPAGFYTTGCDENMTACKAKSLCPAGYFSFAAATVCTKCPMGRYSDNMGATKCIFVPAGTYSQNAILICRMPIYIAMPKWPLLQTVFYNTKTMCKWEIC